jgi:tetratricopeptide (TPR) repeat protein
MHMRTHHHAKAHQHRNILTQATEWRKGRERLPSSARRLDHQPYVAQSQTMSSPPPLFDHQPYVALPDARALNNRAVNMADGPGGDLAGALPLHQQVLVLAQAAHSHAPTPQTTLDVVYAMYNLGITKSNVGNFPGAQALLEQAVALAEQPPVGPAHPRLAQALRLLGVVMIQRGRYDEADATMQRALTMQEQLLGPNHEEVSETLSHMGDSCIKQGNYRRAKGLLKRAVAIAELHVVPNQYPQKLSRALTSLAAVYRALKDYALAESMAEQSLALEEQFKGPHHPDVAVGLASVAGCLRSRGKLREAVPLMGRVLAINERVYDSRHPELATTLRNLGLLYFELGDFARAKSLQERALIIVEQAFGPQHLSVARCLVTLASIARQSGDLAPAKAWFEQALSIYQTQLGRTHPDTAHILRDLAALATISGRPRQAAALTQRAATAAVAATHQPCGWCGTMDVHASKKCGQCQAVWYCNEECQREAWKEHKHHCHKKPSVPKPKEEASAGGDADDGAASAAK